jgi:hypothetical protein
MSFELEDLTPRYRIGVFTPTDPLVVEWNPTSADSRNFVLAISVSAVTGAGPIYATQSVETTWDDGTTWDTVTGVELQDVTATGRWLAYATAIMSPVSPRCRLVVTPVAAHTITVETIKRSKHAPGDSPSSSPPNTTGGVLNVTIAAPIGPDTIANSLPITIATDEFGQEAMAASLPVVIASDQSDLPVDIQGPLAQQVMAASIPVVIASDQTDLPSEIVGPFGQDVMVASVPVVIASDQSPVQVAGLVSEPWLGLTVAYPSDTQETYEFFEDAAKTTSICVVTIDYSDSSKINMTSVVRA